MGEERTPQEWREFAASNRERIKALEHELERTRENVHMIRDEIAAVRYLAKEVGNLARDVHELGKRVEKIATRALEKPTATGLGVFAQYVSIIISLAALAVVATR